MKLKTVYGPPPEDEERIESFTLEQDNEIQEHAVDGNTPVASRKKKWQKEEGQ
ncbi:hypothetical protein Ga0466249_005163 [Sporomusaceae bacterium BoRhaA]|uniref:hypothetical protein n=1 Tax=Pelorhabdus rhamnosifermentans TaxID=2772457 RepID=UPI001C063346|nr:hypothetical protein [Pelorhabdus rhamnosifermentans]MBU2704011.1 hypothetical protein [Pelorhabdus rhamnosifermentans]